ncbi:peptidylprolyl isomerase [Devosia sp.]|uniref:peptidylprolyl isomerase n=1 Tax=Devosia sp. TaxID=1871048 RepID=UPI002F25BE91
MTDRTGPARGKVIRSIAGALLLGSALLAGGSAGLAQEAPAAPAAPGAATPAVTPETVVATVGGEAITEAELGFAAEDLQQQLAQFPPAERRAYLLSLLIEVKLLAKAARDEQMDKTDRFARRLKYLEERELRRTYLSGLVEAGVTPEAVRAAYDAYVAGFEPQDEVHARHILVATEEDAKAIKDELAAGKPFEQLAAEKSTDPSAAQNGGDLGFFVRGMMVKPFEDAAFALTEPGQVSEPVQSQFGWHVIRLEEKRKSQPPSFEDLQQQLQQQVLFELFEKTVDELKQGVAIDIPDAALAEAVKRQSEPQGQ